MKRVIIVSIFLFLNSLLFSQTVTKPINEMEFFKDTIGYTADYGGNIVVSADMKLEKIIYNYKLAFKSEPEVFWKVQIYFGTGPSGRADAHRIKNNFNNKYPEIPSEIVFEEPYFKVRVGKYKTKFEAERLKAKLLEEYDKIFIVEDIKK